MKRLVACQSAGITLMVAAGLAAPSISGWPAAAGALAADGRGPAGRSESTAAAAPSSPLQTAYALFQLGNYPAAADAFEKILQTATPEPRLYYYAALANQQAKRGSRAKQIADYITKNFPTSGEAASLNSLPIVTGPGKNAAGTGKGAASAAAPATAMAAGDAGAEPAGPHVKGARAFSPEDIAKDGAHAIDQSLYPNCWFEASMSSLAMLPRGQRLLSNMIHCGDGESYVVRFPGDGVEYVVSKADAFAKGIANKALWASLLECAQIKKFPNNQGSNGEYADKSRLEVGMGCITGAKAEEVYTANASASELSSFIGGALRSGNPIIACTWDARTIGGMPELIIPTHAYTIIGLDPAKNMVKMRNPHGAGSRRFSLANDPQHLKFEQNDDGVFSINLELVPSYFFSIARSFI